MCGKLFRKDIKAKLLAQLTTPSGSSEKNNNLVFWPFTIVYSQRYSVNSIH